MPVIRHVIDLSGPAFRERREPSWGIDRVGPGPGLDRLRPLLAAVGSDPRPGHRPSLAGVGADLAGRAGRAGVGFAARSLAGGPDADRVGLAVVIEARVASGPRFSMATLLVHPAVRRQGVATALLAAAFAHVRSCGGTELCVETLGSWTEAVCFWRRILGGGQADLDPAATALPHDRHDRQDRHRSGKKTGNSPAGA